MKRMTLLFAAIAISSIAAMAQGKTLVAYFSATGNTQRVAKQVATITGGELYEITPAEEYTSADLDWHDNKSRSSVEMNDKSARPAIIADLENADSYDTIFIGYPIWWNEAPRIINTFIEKYSFAGKRVIPFATSGGSSISNSATQLRRSYPDIDWGEALLLNRATNDDIKNWIKRQQ